MKANADNFTKRRWFQPLAWADQAFCRNRRVDSMRVSVVIFGFLVAGFVGLVAGQTRDLGESYQIVFQVETAKLGVDPRAGFVLQKDGSIMPAVVNEDPTSPIAFTNRFLYRKSPNGSLLVELDPTQDIVMGDSVPDLNFGEVFAKFGSEHLCRRKGFVFNYAESLEPMKDPLKNGFTESVLQFERQLAGISGFGIADFFDGDIPDGLKGSANQAFSLILKRDPTVSCSAILAARESNSPRLDVVFTNREGEAVGYHYSYSEPSGVAEYPFRFIHLVVTNQASGVSRLRRTTRFLAEEPGMNFDRREHFGFGEVDRARQKPTPQFSVWAWKGDTIEGMAGIQAVVTAEERRSSEGLGFLPRAIIAAIFLLPAAVLIVRRLRTRN